MAPCADLLFTSHTCFSFLGKSEDGGDLCLDMWRYAPGDEVQAPVGRGGKASVVLWIHGGGWRAGNKNKIPDCILPVLEQVEILKRFRPYRLHTD
jgi:hypothetical protein